MLWESACRALAHAGVHPADAERQPGGASWSISAPIWFNASLHTLVTTLLGFAIAVVFGLVLGVADRRVARWSTRRSIRC